MAEIHDYTDKHANICMYVFKYASETHVHLAALRTRTLTRQKLGLSTNTTILII